MPFKLSQDRRHHIPRQRHKVTNWPAYEASLRQRGSLTIWFTNEPVAAWQAEARTTRGGQPWYSPLAILTALTLTDAVLPLQGVGGRKPSRPQSRAQQISAKGLALDQPAEAWQAITWREDGEMFTSRFTRLRIRPVTRAKQPPEVWLLIEWPEDEPEPTKYRLSICRSRSAVSPGSRSNGAPAAFPGTYSGFDGDTQAPIDRRTRRISATMPLLRRRTRHRGTADCLTQ